MLKKKTQNKLSSGTKPTISRKIKIDLYLENESRWRISVFPAAKKKLTNEHDRFSSEIDMIQDKYHEETNLWYFKIKPVATPPCYKNQGFIMFYFC